MTHYELLGLEPCASPDDVKRAYRQQAACYHPDVYRGNHAYAVARMQAINEAYAVLGDTRRRAAYDHTLTPPAPPGEPPTPSAAPAPSTRETDDPRVYRWLEKGTYLAAVLLALPLVIVLFRWGLHRCAPQEAPLVWLALCLDAGAWLFSLALYKTRRLANRFYYRLSGVLAAVFLAFLLIVAAISLRVLVPYSE